MSDGAEFGDAEKEELKRRLAVLTGSASLACPRCDATLERRDIPPRTDISYVRRRVLLLCGSCGRKVVLDRPTPGTR